MAADPRGLLLQSYSSALNAVHGTRVVREALAGTRGEHAVAALGKAAAAMAEGATGVDGITVHTGFIASPRGYGVFDPPDSTTWQVRYGGHPVPDSDSIAAGDALIAWLRALPSAMPLLVLMSGGSSACIEALKDGVSLDGVAARTRELLASGADIRRLNAARGDWSRLKYGGALRHAGSRPIDVLVLSDVPDDEPMLVGSGPFVGRAPNADARVVAGNRTAVEAVLAAGRLRKLDVHDCGSLDGDAAGQGAATGRMLRDAAPGLHVWGGETSVVLPPRPGRGGRCQQFALAAAQELDGVGHVTLLVAATDGVDGDSPDAGALVDGGTITRLRDEGIDARDALARADANPALAAAGDLVHTGPTGTNVRDLVLALVT